MVHGWQQAWRRMVTLRVGASLAGNTANPRAGASPVLAVRLNRVRLL